MKKMSRILCLTVFLLLCLLTISFLHQFTRVDETMDFIDWESGVHIGEDGQEEPFDPNTTIGNEPVKEGGSYRFTASLPSDLPAGYLLFETSGMKITMTLDGKNIYSSDLKIPGDDYATSQAQLTLAPGTSGSLVVTCTPSKKAASLFPPLIRFFPEKLREKENYAYTNLQALPSGASAMAFLLVSGLLLLSILRGHPDYTLIPLALAAALLMSYRLIQTQGYYFLPEKILSICYWRGWGLAIPLLLLIYLVMNRRRSFLSQLGFIAGITVAILVVCTLISYLRGGYLSRYLSSSLDDLNAGYYDGLLYWFTLWLTGVCASLSAYGIASDFARQQTEKQTLALKTRLITNNYHAMEDKIHQTAAWRHEWQHQIHSMRALLEKKDYEGMTQFLEQIHPEQILLSKTTFTDNVFVNTILQDFYSRACRQGIHFTAHILLPKDLPIPEADLCTLLMNMLENALEACEKLSGEKERSIHIKMKLRQGYLAISCENSYNGEIKTSRDGRILTSKEDSSCHGLGMRQMEIIAEKYHSTLFTEYDNKNTFLIQTALKLPKTDEPERQS